MTAWTRLNIVVEGQTEEEFANEVLRPHLSQYGISVSARMVSNRREHLRKYKGGLLEFEPLRLDISLWMREERTRETRFTTMVDLYAYPNDAPGYDNAQRLQPYDKVRRLEQNLADAVNDTRFIPYIQLHEFETILFADMSKWGPYFLGQGDALNDLRHSVISFNNVELINDDERTAPSKRILQHLPEYDKVLTGNVLALEIGLQTIRDQCRHFNEWITQLEKLGHVH
ncbi:MAG TPA: DUF4276 family protein [Candidatus Hydrogenedentes bacterium]|nr:MAG: hypothetical protein BWY09_01577 [Candidatus Hydrogenedentes bacterium ADurb.Bin179]HOH30437.1 DUF4276 family protein [Candidatus Hydrogenedentota bacterium]